MLQQQKIYIQYLDDLQGLLDQSPLDVGALIKMKEHIQHQELIVPLIGAFNAGKSSLINSFLGENILPVAITPDTELATELRYGTDPHILAVRIDETTERFNVSEFDAIKRRSAEFSFIKIYLDNSRLQEITPIVLVDMPGFDSSLENHNKAIGYYLPRGVYFAVLISVEEGNLTHSMSQQLLELESSEKDFSIFISKTNSRADQETQAVLEHIVDQVESQLGAPYGVVALTQDNGNQLSQFLSKLNAEQIIENLYLSLLKDQFHTVMSQISLAKTALKNDSNTNKVQVDELNQSLRQLQRAHDSLLDDAQACHSGRIIKRCVTQVAEDLEANSNDLVSVALNNHPEFSKAILATIKRSIREKLSEEFSAINLSIAEHFVSNIDTFNLQLEPRRLLNSVEESASFKASLYSVFTQIMSVIIKVLPSFAKNFVKDYQAEQLHIKLTQQIIPTIQQEISTRLPDVVNKHLDQIISQLRITIETELTEKKVLISNIESEQIQHDSKSELKITTLNDVETKARQLAENVLY